MLACNLVYDPNNQRRLTAVALLILWIEPVPTFGLVCRFRLDRVRHQTSVFISDDVHVRSAGEIVDGLRASVQHHDKRARLTAVSAGHVELVIAAPCSAKIRVIGKSTVRVRQPVRNRHRFLLCRQPRAPARFRRTMWSLRAAKDSLDQPCRFSEAALSRESRRLRHVGVRNGFHCHPTFMVVRCTAAQRSSRVRAVRTFARTDWAAFKVMSYGRQAPHERRCWPGALRARLPMRWL